MRLFFVLAPADFNMNRPLADRFMIEIGRWPRGAAPLAIQIEVFRRKIEMWVLNSYQMPYNYAVFVDLTSKR